MAGLGKYLLKQGPVQGALAALLAGYLAVLRATVRWQLHCPEETEALFRAETPFVACFWHGRIAMMPATWTRRQPVDVLISGHRDGALIARAITHLGFRTVTGSSKRGGREALRNICRLLDDGHGVAITPDGPRGPRMRAKGGAIKVAQLSGASILPLGVAVKHRRIIHSWDRFCLARPFSRGVIVWGAPLAVPRQLSEPEFEAWRLRLEEQLNALTAEADQKCGHRAIEPAPAIAEVAASLPVSSRG